MLLQKKEILNILVIVFWIIINSVNCYATNK